MLPVPSQRDKSFEAISELHHIFDREGLLGGPSSSLLSLSSLSKVTSVL